MNNARNSGSWPRTLLSILLLAVPLVALGRWYMIFSQHPELAPQAKTDLYRQWLPSFLGNNFVYAFTMSAFAAAAFYLASSMRWKKGFPERMLNLLTMVLAALVILQMVFSLL